MENKEVMMEVQKIINSYHLSDVQEIVFFQSFLGATYSEMAYAYGYNPDYIKEVGANLWKLLSIKLRLKVNKKNLRAVIRKKYPENGDIIKYLSIEQRL